MLKISDFLKAFDMYAAPITLKCKNVSQARSACSGMISFLILSFVLGYFVYKIIEVATSSETVVTVKFN